MKHCFRLPALAGVRLRKNNSPPPDRGLQRREPGNILSMRRAPPGGRDWIKVTISEATKNYDINLQKVNKKLQPRKFKKEKKIVETPPLALKPYEKVFKSLMKKTAHAKTEVL
jgi:hypothetical protein